MLGPCATSNAALLDWCWLLSATSFATQRCLVFGGSDMFPVVRGSGNRWLPTVGEKFHLWSQIQAIAMFQREILKQMISCPLEPPRATWPDFVLHHLLWRELYPPGPSLGPTHVTRGQDVLCHLPGWEPSSKLCFWILLPSWAIWGTCPPATMGTPSKSLPPAF